MFMGMLMRADHCDVGFISLRRLVGSGSVVSEGFSPGVGDGPGRALVLLGRPGWPPPGIDTGPDGTHCSLDVLPGSANAHQILVPFVRAEIWIGLHSGGQLVQVGESCEEAIMTGA